MGLSGGARVKFQRRTPFVPSRGQPYDRRAYKRTAREPKTSLQLVTLYTPFRKELLALIRRNPGVSYHGLARMTGRCDGRIHDNVRHLIEARLVHVVKTPGRSHLYLNGVKHVPPAHAPTQVSQNVQRVYAYLCKHKEATRQDVIRELGLTRHQAYRALEVLEKRGIIRQLRRVTIARLLRDVPLQKVAGTAASRR